MTSFPQSEKNRPVLDTFALATAMLSALRARQISSVELLDMHLQRIERYNPQLNALVIRDDDNARRTAEAADAARMRSEEQPLLGLPLTIKDCIYVKGLPTTGGVPERARAIAEADARIVARVRAGGAVIIGKTNVPPYAADWQSVNPLFGRSNNPWDLTRTPGGSTGGGAAAVAAGLTPLEFGGDLGGSIRIPAAFCGIYGHKPSETALPRSGHFPGPNFHNAAVAMAVQGPLARSAEDLELAFDVVAGPDVGEDIAWHLDIPPARHKHLAEYRVAVLPPIDWLPVDAEILAALDSLVTKLSRAGVKVKVIQPEAFGDLRDYYKIYLSILWTITSTDQPEEERHRQAQEFRATGDEFLVAYARGLEASAADYLIWFSQREHYRAAYRAFFREWDVLLTPANIVNAFPHTDAPFPERTLHINGQMVAYNQQLVYPALANLTGQPATAFPVGLTRTGLPIGLQAIGPYLEDRTPIRFAALVAQAFGGFQRPPLYAAE
jgi:amidase